MIEIATEVTPELVDAFARLVPQLSSSSPPPSAEQLDEMVTSPATVVFLARDGGQVVGCLTLVLFRIPTGLRARIDALQQRLPRGATLEIVQDAGVRVHHAVRNVQEALIEGAVLTVLVVFLFLNSWRSTVITGLALPVSVLASFIAVWAFGFTLNTMSLLGLSLSIGILIDDAIVVRENIVRHIELGKDHVTASHEGTDEIGLAVAATTFSIVAVFVPVAFMYGVAGQWFKPFALTIACAVLVSLFVSFSLDPMLSAYWPDPQTEAHERRNPIARALDRFNRWFERMAEGIEEFAAEHGVDASTIGADDADPQKQADIIRKLMAEKQGISQSAVFEQAIREKARREKLKLPDPTTQVADERETARARFQELIEKARAGFDDLTPEEIEEEVKRAVAEARENRRTGRH